MSFLHAYLLSGLVLAGLPILLHLMLRQKPKRLLFPAFRFLKARQTVNQRRLRLQHLLLMLLRILIIASLCLALARPRLFSHRLGFSEDRAVVAALVFDTSYSMEYTLGGATRLDDARTKARELLAEMKPESRVLLFDSGEDAPSMLLTPSEAGSRLDLLRLRPGAASLNLTVERALRALQKQEDSEEAPPRLLYIFSDRTRASWDSTGLKPSIPPGITIFYVDVGVESPRDLGIERVEVVPAVVAPGANFQIRVSVRGRPSDQENELSCSLDGEDRPPDKRLVRLEAGQTTQLLAFDRVAPTPPPTAQGSVAYQLTLRLGTRDSMPFNNVRHATFHVGAKRRLLTLVDRDDEERTYIWSLVHATTRWFAHDLMTFEQAEKLSTGDLATYSVLALFEPRQVPETWWKRLTAYVQAGGGLAIVPGGEESREALRSAGGAALMPATLEQLVDAPRGQPVYWEPFRGEHPLMAPLVAWLRQFEVDLARDQARPFVRRYWQLAPLPSGSLAISSYEDAKKRPSLVERSVGKGRVILFTTPLDLRYVDEQRTVQWNNFWGEESWFGLVLIDRVCRYLAGETTIPEVNFVCGQLANLRLTMSPPPPLTLTGPGLSGAERTVKPPDAEGIVVFPQAIAPGNYLLVDGKNQPVGGFSLNIAAREGDLERIPIEELEEVLGTGTVLQVDRTLTLKEALSEARQPPVELLPLLLLLLLTLLTVEGLYANRFYRRLPEPRGEP